MVFKPVVLLKDGNYGSTECQTYEKLAPIKAALLSCMESQWTQNLISFYAVLQKNCAISCFAITLSNLFILK